MISLRRLGRSFQYAFRGFMYALRREQNFQIHFAIGLLVVALMIYVRVTMIEAIILILVVTSIWVLEMMNIIFERVVDITRPRIHHYAKIIKDVMAAIVFIASIGAVIVGLLIFLPYFFK